MKKTYIIPKTITVNIVLRLRMLAGSPYGTAIYGDASSSKDVLSRRGRFNWDDEEDEW